jgi:thioesterase domain-containing protein
MSRKTALIGLVAMLMPFAAPVTARAASTPMDPAAFHDGMRQLWEDHITWTRIYIVNALAGLPSKDATAQRLLQNQIDIGNAVKAFYGDGGGEKLTSLLKDHILIAAELIDAAKAGDAAKQDAATKRWSANADDIAAFLSGANTKNWPLPEMKSMMHKHLDLTTAEVVAGLKKDWAADIAAYDEVHVQILKMADMLSAGIVKQFPDKFK